MSSDMATAALYDNAVGKGHMSCFKLGVGAGW